MYAFVPNGLRREGLMYIPSDFLPSGAVPLPTLPVSLRSMNQLSWAPAGFLRVMAKTAPPFLMASLRSASDDDSAWLMRSNEAEDGKAAVQEDHAVLVEGLAWLDGVE